MMTRSLQIRVSSEILTKLSRESSRRGIRTGELVRYILSDAADQLAANVPAEAREAVDAS
jgi:predicted DNA binding CopG/RHH family protein